MNGYQRSLALLKELKLKGVETALDTEINEAETQKASYIGFLGSLLESEIRYRTERPLSRFPIDFVGREG